MMQLDFASILCSHYLYKTLGPTMPTLDPPPTTVFPAKLPFHPSPSPLYKEPSLPFLSLPPNILKILPKNHFLIKHQPNTKMAKGGKLTKLKSVLKKLNSFNNKTRPTVSAIAAATDDSSPIAGDLHPVYVGKSRRRYLISSDIIDHPLFKELAERSSESDTINVSCEVVLFEHLLWMLENADPQPESLEELVEFYAC